MARDGAPRRRRRTLIDVMLPAALPAVLLVAAPLCHVTKSRAAPALAYDQWSACVLSGCRDVLQANEAHSFPYLASFVSLMFLFGISVGWQVIAMEGQKKLMNIRVKPGPGGGG